MIRGYLARLADLAALAFAAVAVIVAAMGKPELAPVYLTVPAIVWGRYALGGYRARGESA